MRLLFIWATLFCAIVFVFLSVGGQPMSGGGNIVSSAEAEAD